VGICVGINKVDGTPLIAHVTGHGIMGYAKQTLNEVFDASGGDRSFVVFRAKDPAVGLVCSQIATAYGKLKDKIKEEIERIGIAANEASSYSAVVAFAQQHRIFARDAVNFAFQNNTIKYNKV